MIAATLIAYLYHMEQSIGQNYDLFYQACGCISELRENA